MATIKIEGLDELVGQFERVKKTAHGPEIQRALRESADMLAREVESRAPIAPRPTQRGDRMIAPGGLRRSIKAASGRQHKTFMQAFVLTLKNLAPHARLVERGTKPHVIKAKIMKFFAGAGAPTMAERIGIFARRAGGFAFAKKVNHPGAKANPFFSDAVRAKRGAIKRHLESRVKAAFEALAIKRAA